MTLLALVLGFLYLYGQVRILGGNRPPGCTGFVLLDLCGAVALYGLFGVEGWDVVWTLLGADILVFIFRPARRYYY